MVRPEADNELLVFAVGRMRNLSRGKLHFTGAFVRKAFIDSKVYQ